MQNHLTAATFPRGISPFSVRLREPVLWETLALATICFLDMAWTIAAIKMGIARESNPLMAAIIRQGMVPFALVKTFSFLVPLGSLECLRSRIPKFVAISLRVGLIAYILIYAIGSLHVHGYL